MTLIVVLSHFEMININKSLVYFFDTFFLAVCFRLLLRILQQQQASFVLRHSENTLKSTDEVLQRLNPQDSTLQALTQVRTHC